MIEARSPDHLRCRVCALTERRAWTPHCGWADANLCGRCAAMAEALARWLHGSRWRGRTALWREAERVEQEMYHHV